MIKRDELKAEIKQFPYIIAEELRNLGWIVKSPNQQVYENIIKGELK